MARFSFCTFYGSGDGNLGFSVDGADTVLRLTDEESAKLRAVAENIILERKAALASSIAMYQPPALADFSEVSGDNDY